ncbi:MAG: GGDEF domain-containing protein [Desulfurivibrio sp.]|nr:GGDEF domain-containing protein [Desulfurivibrio sp.]MBU3936226.1 GGDEF domain-containing protein [Pseudomonadota bacterium]MBU4118909.1 GGDEF domain-containing protein [Pseudomonadota bacterium]
MHQRIIRWLIYVVIVLFMANISPVIDSFLHPDIPYFDPEHLLVGGITSAITALLLSLLVSHANRMASIAHELSHLNRTLREQTSRDSLTGLYNHRYFQEMLRHEFLLAQRHQTELSCMMLDLDLFKDVNDTCGHPFGDLVLKGTAEQILHEARTTDTVARYGGEEFAILLPNTDLEGATRIGERIRARMEEYIHQDKDVAMRVTISIGLASHHAHTPNNPEKLLFFADRALYQAKNAGRNKVIAYSDRVEIEPP